MRYGAHYRTVEQEIEHRRAIRNEQKAEAPETPPCSAQEQGEVAPTPDDAGARKAAGEGRTQRGGGMSERRKPNAMECEMMDLHAAGHHADRDPDCPLCIEVVASTAPEGDALRAAAREIERARALGRVNAAGELVVTIRAAVLSRLLDWGDIPRAKPNVLLDDDGDLL